MPEALACRAIDQGRARVFDRPVVRFPDGSGPPGAAMMGRGLILPRRGNRQVPGRCRAVAPRSRAVAPTEGCAQRLGGAVAVARRAAPRDGRGIAARPRARRGFRRRPAWRKIGGLGWEAG